ncbi:hypothetical protein Dimus_011279 [Dionaea muscipula]
MARELLTILTQYVLMFVRELVSSGVTKKDKRQEQTGKDCSFFDLLSLDGSAVKSHPETTSAIDEPEVGTNDVVQTYLDERGHVRVSRVRAMGIRMTRDLQRNLDLMRELEQERPTTNATELVQFDPREKVSVDLGSSEGRKRCLETAEACSHENDFLRGTNSLSAVGRHTHEPAEIGNTIEISFVDNDDQKSSEDVEGLFADLVAGKPMMFSTIGDSQPIVHTSDPALDCEWEEGLVGEEPDNVTNARNMEVDAFQVDGFNDKVIELDWEEGMPDSRKDVHLSPGACEKCPSKGSLEEDLALQEAIRRSLEDFAAGISITVPSESEKIEEVVDHTSSQLLRQENEIAEPSFQIVNNIQVRGTLGLLGDESDDSSLNTYVDDVSGEPLTSSTVSTSHDMRDMTDCPKSLCSPDNQNRAQDVGSSSFLREIVETKSVDVADVDLNESNSHAAPMCPSNKASDVAMHHEESTMEQPVSDTHLKSQLADENCPDLVQEIKDDDMICAVESSEGDDVEFKKTCLEDELQDLSREYIILGEEQRKLERNAESVNSEMFVECQELLQMFGLPYIIAPMEAEAQCAFMERAKLVDGVVTDDSDVFLFGARSVYKNIFDNRKYVETYFMKDIEDDLGLDQEKLIRMALLLGSDYTEGISGIGIVNAIEVIHAFPDEDGLSKFREWIESPDPMILGKLGMKSTTELSDNGSSFVETDPEGPPVGDFNDLPGTMDSQTESNGQKLRQFFMDKHVNSELLVLAFGLVLGMPVFFSLYLVDLLMQRKVSKNWHVPSSFPSEAVISAYRSPQVDKSSDPFSWGKPDLFALRRLCWEKFGWGGPKADELLLPVLKEYNKHETQLRLEAFYTFNERFAKIRSKRIKQAVKGITKNQSTKLTGETDTGQDAFDDIQKRTVRSTHRINKRKTPKDNASGISDHSVEHKKSQPRKRRAQEIGTGRRKAKIRGNPQAVATGRRKSNSASECAETSSSDADHIDDLEHGMLAGTPQGPCNIRKSMRPRKAANYVECDVEIDESLYLNKCQANCSRAELVEEQLSYDAAGSFAVEPPVGEDSLVTDGLSKDYLVQGGGFCADEDEVETGEAQWCSLLHNDGASCDTEMDHVQVCGTFTDDGAIRNEHECDPSETATEATKIVNPSLCFSEAQMCENNSIERKLIESSRGSLERAQQPKHINEEDEDDQHLIWNDNLSRRDNRGHRSSKTDDQTGVKASSTDNCGHRNSKSDDQTGVKVKASSTMPNSRRNKRMRSSP